MKGQQRFILGLFVFLVCASLVSAASESLPSVVGMYASIMVLILIASQLTGEHVIGKLLIVIFAVIFLFVANSALLNTSQCDYYAANTTKVDVNASYHFESTAYVERCVPQTSSARTYYLGFIGFMVAASIYSLIYLIIWAFNLIQKWSQAGRQKKREGQR